MSVFLSPILSAASVLDDINTDDIWMILTAFERAGGSHFTRHTTTRILKR